MLAPNKKPALANKNPELSARLKVAEEQLRLLRDENRQLKSELTQKNERTVLLEEELPEHFPRIVIEHDLPVEQKLCTACAVPHPLTRIGQETRECYRFTPPKISVEHHVRRPTCARRAARRRSPPRRRR